MHAIRPSAPGGPEVLVLAEQPTPEPNPKQVRVRTEAIGVNFIDVYTRSGQYPSARPIPLGLEGAGVIEAVGREVTDLAPGDRVGWTSSPGSYATHVLVAADRAVPLPASGPIDARMAAAALLQGLTAHYLAHSTFPLGAGHSAIVHAASGGVGLLLVQLAKRAGARVLATVSTREKAELASAAGADHVVLYAEQDFEAEARRWTGGLGVDVVYDSVGKTTFEKSLSALKPRGYMVLYGQSSGAVPALDPQVLAAKGSIFLTRPTLVHYTATREELLSRTNALFDLIASGSLDVRISQTYALAEAARAHRDLESRKTTGKLLLIP